MKKIILLATILLATATFSQRIVKGEKQVNAGIGLGGPWGLPFYAGVDFGVHPDITVGGELSYASSTRSYGYANNSYSYTTSVFSISANGNYHFNRLLKMDNKYDLYCGIGLGYWIEKYGDSEYSQFNNNNNSANHVVFTGQAGFRYFFTDKLAANIELGGAIPSTGKLGITYKF